MIEAQQIEDVLIDDLVAYGCRDADGTLRLVPVLRRKLKKVGRYELFKRLYLRPLRALIRMEIAGVQLAPERLQKLEPYYEDRMSDAAEAVRGLPCHEQWSRENRKENKKRVRRGVLDESQPKWVYPEINLGSPPQVQRLFYGTLELPDTNVRGKQDLSTGEDRIVDIGRQLYEESGECEALTAIRSVLTYRNAQKRRSSYVRKFLAETPNRGQPSTAATARFEPKCGVWVAHPVYNQSKVRTGRLSAQDPPIQTIPRHSPIRGAFVSRYENGIVLKADFSQMELRVLACLAGDERLIAVLGGEDKRFKEFKGDIHLYTASVIYKKAASEVHEDERHRAKSVSFGIIYGRQAPAIALETGLTTEDAEALIESYFDMFPAVRRFVERMHKQVHEHGMVVGPTGRIYPIEAGLLSQKSTKLSYEEERKLGEAERYSVNYPIQGAASDIGLDSLVRISDLLVEENYRTVPFTFVHDSIETDSVPAELKQVSRLMADVMLGDHGELFEWLTVPLKVEFELGADWEKTMKLELEGDRVKLTGNGKFYPPLRRRLASHFKIRDEEMVSKGIKVETSAEGPRLSLEDREERPPYEKLEVSLTLN